MCVQGDLLTLGTRNMWFGQGPASSLNCPVILVLEFQSIGNASPIVLPWAERGASTSNLTCMVE